jgi:NAD dependent epimerase/dehydratase family enzyme
VGKHLTDLLLQNGYSVSILSRKKKKYRLSFLLHLGEKQIIEKESVLNADYIVHLAGEILRASGGHNNAKKLLLLVENNLPNSFMEQNKVKPEAFISASGWYIRCSQWSSHLHRGSKARK